MVLVFLVGVVVAGCGSSSTSSSGSPNLAGRSYVSTKVTGHAMPSGTHVALRFGTDGMLSADAGCNTMGGTYHVEGGRLVVGQLAMTEMGCMPPARQAQDGWLAGILNERPRLEESAGALRLVAGTTTIDLAGR